MSKCPTREKLVAFLAGGEVEERVRSHVGECPRCSSAMASLRGVLQLSALLQDVPPAAGRAASMPPELAERIFDKVNPSWQQRHSRSGGGSVRQLEIIQAGESMDREGPMSGGSVPSDHEIRGLSQQIADSLRVQHVSFHFLVNEQRLIAPREMCHNYHLPFDLVTDVSSSGLTSHMVRNPGVYNLSGQAIKAHAKARGGLSRSRFTPVYKQECNALLSIPFYVHGRLGGLIKLENRRNLRPGRLGPRNRPFTDSEVERLRQTLEAASPILTRAYHWVRDHHPDPQVYISQDFDKPAA